MTTIWERVFSALTPLGWPISQDVRLAADGADIPDQYLVYTLITGVGQEFADNQEENLLHHVQVSWFSKNAFSGASLTALLGAMKTAGFTKGPITSMPYNNNARLFCLALEFYFLEEE